jgi:ferredoxin-NADP reductase
MEETPVTVAGVHEVGPDAIALDLETPAGFDARPGQFVKLVTSIAGDEHSRFYSISSPDVADTFEMTIGIDPDGTVSPYLRELAVGDQVTLSGPYGNAYYESEPAVCILAGGPGVGPAIGIVERTLEEGGEAAVIYRDDHPIHEDRLAAVESRGAFVHLLGEGEPLTGALEAGLVDDAQVFVYGFADFLDDAMTAIGSVGGEPDAAKVENFG